MLSITPIQTKSEQAEACSLCGIEYLPDALAYKAEEGGRPLGVCQFRVRGGSVEVYHIREAEGTDDLEALLLLGRAALSFAEACGAHEALLYEERRGLPALLGAARAEGGAYRIDLRGYFEHKCRG